MNGPDVIFVVGHPRSGTTMLTKILDLATNAQFHVEQPPKLCVAARTHYDYGVPHVRDFLRKSKQPSINAAHGRRMKYGDKNQNYLHFIEELASVWDCRFVIIHRDGRDVVRSKMQWDSLGKTNYGRYEDDPEGVVTQAEEDFWDYSRLRPRPGEAVYERWRQIPKFEKFCWAWARFHHILFEALSRLPDERYIVFGVESLSSETVQRLYAQLGLTGFDEKPVRKLLTARINTSVRQGVEGFPDWTEWSDKQKSVFLRHGRRWMERLGYGEGE
jgi:hypothetical protein